MSTRVYLYEKAGRATKDDTNVKVAEAVYPGKQKEETSTVGNVGKGASIGATAGSVIPIPGVGTAVGTVVGGLVGLGTGIFGGGPDQTQFDRVLPSLLQPVFAKAGAQTEYRGGTNSGFGTKALYLKGKSFDPDRVMATVEKVIDKIARKNGVEFNDKGNAETYKDALVMSTQPPQDTGQLDGSEDLILSFPKKIPRSEASTNAEQTKRADARSTVYAIGIAAVAAYILS